jgi:hypothetical protein
MRGVVFCLVVVAGCTSSPPSTVISTGRGADPGLSAGAGAGAVPTAGGGANAGSTAGTGANAVSTAGVGANRAPTAAKAANTSPVDATGRPVNRGLVAQGYRPTTYRGQLYYCRKEKLTGSQFTHKVCLTEQEAALQERIAQDEMNKRNSAGKCLPPLCPRSKQ